MTPSCPDEPSSETSILQLLSDCIQELGYGEVLPGVGFIAAGGDGHVEGVAVVGAWVQAGARRESARVHADVLLPAKILDHRQLFAR